MINKNKVVNTFLDMTNLGLTLIVALLYLWRTHDMCAFDLEPIWKVYRSETCSGVHQGWYYILLLIVHVYYLLEYIARLLTQRYVWKYLKSIDSILEIMTIFPFIIAYISVGTKSPVFQFFIMFDQMRLFNYKRIT